MLEILAVSLRVFIDFPASRAPWLESNFKIHFTLRQHFIFKAFSIRKVGYPRQRLADGLSIQTDPDIGHNHVYNPVSSKG